MLRLQLNEPVDVRGQVHHDQEISIENWKIVECNCLSSLLFPDQVWGLEWYVLEQTLIAMSTHNTPLSIH